VRQEARKADLVLCLGGELDGATAELVVASAAGRSRTGLPYGKGGALGTVLVRGRPSPHDSSATLRFNCSNDRLVRLLVERCGLAGEVRVEVVPEVQEEEEVLDREGVLDTLEGAEQFDEGDPRLLHGRLFHSTCLLAPGQEEGGLLRDGPAVAGRKVAALRDLLRLSTRTVVYTEAVAEDGGGGGHYGAGQCGLSQRGAKLVPGEGPPACYPALAVLAQAGLLHAWLQRGHDGLPQRAGFPGPVLEVWDSWRDHHQEGYSQELAAADAEIAQADLVLVLTFGSPFTGSTARLVAEAGAPGARLGVAVLGQAATGLDPTAALRINLPPDQAIADLLASLGDLPRPEGGGVVQVSDSAVEAANVGGGAPERCSFAPAGEEGGGQRRLCPSPDTSHRAQVADCLSGHPVLAAGDPRLPHGRLLANTCLEAPQDGRDREAMLDYKVRRLAHRPVGGAAMVGQIKLQKQYVAA
jgi:hypothetical protein